MSSISRTPIKYAKASLQERKTLVRSVLIQGQSIFDASQTLHIKYSTAKLILHKFNLDGTFSEKKLDRYHRMERLRTQNDANNLIEAQIMPQQVENSNILQQIFYALPYDYPTLLQGYQPQQYYFFTYSSI